MTFYFRPKQKRKIKLGYQPKNKTETDNQYCWLIIIHKPVQSHHLTIKLVYWLNIKTVPSVSDVHETF